MCFKIKIEETILTKLIRIGQIVPSSNTTMETELPLMLRARETVAPERFTFHSSRMRMKKVTAEELAAMDDRSEQCALELSDAQVDVLAYACLVAIMSRRKGYHRESETRLHEATARNGKATPVVTSAGALINGLQALRAKKVVVVTPYMRPLTQLVCDYIESEGIEVLRSVSLEIEDNLEVGARNPLALIDIAKDLDLTGADALVISACVQMPSLAAIPIIEKARGIPVVSAAVCTTYTILQRLGLGTYVPNAGTLLSGKY
jgi:maleate isomerase